MLYMRRVKTDKGCQTQFTKQPSVIYQSRPCIYTVQLLLMLFLQIFEESSKLQNIRLERQQALQKRHLRELKEFAEAYSSNDKLSQLPPSSSSSSQRERQNSEHGSVGSEQSHCSSQTSIGKVSL